MIVLRPYQLRAIEEVRDAIRAGHRRVMLTVPTGGGKTLTAAAILAAALSKGSRTMFVAHRLELIDQTWSTFLRLGIESLGVIRAQDCRADISQPIQIASIQTLVRRTVLPNIKIVVIDEAHRSAAKSYKRALFDAYPDAIFLGLTATPCRTDGKPLGDDWHHLVVGARYSELIEGGHLAEPLIYSTPVLPDLAKVHTVAGDYNQEELEAAVNKGSLIGGLVEQWSRLASGRRTVAFAVSVAHSQAIVAQFVAAGIKAEHLDGTTPEDERKKILARLASGATTLVSNVGVLCEGWDCPPVKVLLLARPTKSLVLYLQMAGRILRPCGELQPLILDHGGNFDRHGAPHLDREWSLEARPKLIGEALSKCCKACFAYVPRSCAECPHCGFVFAAEAPPPGVKEAAEPIPVDLALRTLVGPDAQLSFFCHTAKLARKRGWKFGSVPMRFRERFGVEPPHEWIVALRSDYRRDVEWKAAVAEREPERRAWHEKQAVSG